MIEASVVMTTKDRAPYLQGALAALCEQTFSPSRYEVVVVDNGSTDATQRVVEDFAKDASVSVRYVYEKRIGLHYARHAGATHAAGDIIVYTEDDVVTPTQWLEAMYDCFDEDSVKAVAAGLTGAWEVKAPSWIDRLGTSYLGLLDLGEGTFELPRHSYLCGGNFAIRKSTLFDVGGFNPDLLPAEQLHLRGDGESGLLIKLRQAGHRVMYCSRATVEHVVSREKLELTYVINRYRREGISRAYTLCRGHRGNRLLLCLDSLISISRLCVYKVMSLIARNDDRKVSRAAFSSYLKSRWEHDVRLLRDGQLRRYVLRDSYMDERST